MDARDAAKIAIREVASVFADQQVDDLRLEEFERSGGDWLVTVSFLRVKDRAGMEGGLGKRGRGLLSEEWDREYKVATIGDDGAVRAIRNYRSTVA